MSKRVFDISQSYEKEPIMVCYTREQSDAFREFMHRSGRTWRGGESYSTTDYYDSCPEGIIYYRFVKGVYSRFEYSDDSIYELFSFEDFEWGDLYKDDFEQEDNGEEIDAFLNQFHSNERVDTK